MDQAIRARLDDAKWILERQLAWISQAEVKVAALVSVQIAMLAGLGAVFLAADEKSTLAWLATWACGLLAAMAVFCAAMAVDPQTGGPERSLIFFGRIEELRYEEFARQLHHTQPSELLEDFAAQIYRNAEIAKSKHRWVARATKASFLSALPWLIAIGSLSEAL